MSTIIDKAKEIVEVNGMSDKITLLQGKMEEVELPFPEVDIIISEWMGYFLLYESMLDTVLWARDRYLRKDGQGLIFPDKATIFMAGIEDGDYKEDKIGCMFFLAHYLQGNSKLTNLHSLGQRLGLRLLPSQVHRPHRAPRRHRRAQGRCHRPRARHHPRSLHLHR
jgi:protein arginine N-methyltransferase 1